MELRITSTTYEGKERITREQTIPFCDDGGREEQLINLYPQVIYQQMDGFGGAITDSAAYIYSLMNPEQKKRMLDEYFGQGTMKYRFVRIPIDSCDFSLTTKRMVTKPMRRLRASLLRGWKNIFSRCWQMRKRLMGADWRSCCLRGARRRT